jgi:cytochrome c
MIAVVGLLIARVSATADAGDGALVYSQQCAKCHGATGLGDTAAGKALKVPQLVGDTKVAGMSIDELANGIKANEKHKAFVGKLAADDLAAAAAHAKSLAGGP